MGLKFSVYWQTLTFPYHGLWEKTLEAGLLTCLNSFRKHRVAFCWIAILTVLLQTNQYFNYVGLLPPPGASHHAKPKTLTILIFTPKISLLHLIPLLPVKTLSHNYFNKYASDSLFWGDFIQKQTVDFSDYHSLCSLWKRSVLRGNPHLILISDLQGELRDSEDPN